MIYWGVLLEKTEAKTGSWEREGIKKERKAKVVVKLEIEIIMEL